MPSMCPLILVAIKKPGIINDPDKEFSECLKTDCAWYMEHDSRDPKTREMKGECAIRAIAFRRS